MVTIPYASWSSLYHLRVSTEENSVQDALLRTGETVDWRLDWSSTAYLSLSTASPSKGGNPPELESHSIRRYYPPVYQAMQQSQYIPTIYDPPLRS